MRHWGEERVSPRLRIDAAAGWLGTGQESPTEYEPAIIDKFVRMN